MGTSERREREREELRNRIIEAAGELIAKEGHERLTIRKLAECIEYSPRTIYLYFRDKDALLKAVVEEGFRRTLQMREPENLSGLPAEAVLSRRVRSHIEAAFSQPNLYRAIVSLIMEKNYEPGDGQKRVIKQTRREVEALLPPDRRTEEEISQLTSILFASIRAVTLSLLNERERLTEDARERFTARFIRFLKNGIKETDKGERE